MFRLRSLYLIFQIFEQRIDRLVYVIHDRAAQFNLDYIAYGIKEIKTSINAPDINAIAERFIGSVRREALDCYWRISEKLIINILQEYIDSYNSKRPHQGIDQRIPNGYEAQTIGRVLKFPVLDGLFHYYMRKAA